MNLCSSCHISSRFDCLLTSEGQKIANVLDESKNFRLHVQSGQITGSGTCSRSGTVVSDLVIFSFLLPFIFYGDLIKFVEINSFSNIYWTNYKVQFECELQS